MSKNYAWDREMCEKATDGHHCHHEAGPCCFCGTDLAIARGQVSEPEGELSAKPDRALPSFEQKDLTLSPYDAAILSLLALIAVGVTQGKSPVKPMRSLEALMGKRFGEPTLETDVETSLYIAQLLTKLTIHSDVLDEKSREKAIALSSRASIEAAARQQDRKVDPRVQRIMSDIFASHRKGPLS